jgi:hypothetical protein
LLAAGLVGSQRLRRHGTLLVDGPAFDACQRLRTALRISRRVSLAVCDRVAQPLLVGIARPLILLPTAALAGWTPEELEMVLLHEMAHVRRWDNLVNLVQRLVESALFFHVAVWLVSRQVRRDREECCDAIVVARTDRPHEYAELLVSIAAALRGCSAPGSLVAASAMADHPLTGRIRRILKLENEPMRVSTKTLAAALAAPLLIACAAFYAVAEGDDSNPPPSKGGARGGINDDKSASDDRAQGGSPREATRGGIEAAKDAPATEEQPPKTEKPPLDSSWPPRVSNVQSPASSDGKTTALLKLHPQGPPLTQQGREKQFRSQEAVVKSPQVLEVALQLAGKPLASVKDRDNSVEALRNRLQVRFLENGEIMELVLQGDQDSAHDDRALLQVLINAYNLHLSELEQFAAAMSPPIFRYDGKPFDEWRDLFKHELKIERRLEALDALAAFARAGYAKQAAEAILDVAGEYDFSRFSIADQSPEGQLRNAIVSRLQYLPAGQFPLKVWLPLLMDRLATDQAKWRPFAKAVFSQMHFGPTYKDPESREQLLRMATDPQYGPNSVALTVLYRMPDNDPQVEQLIKAALRGDDAANALDMLAELRFKNPDYLTEQIDLLFHPDAEVRRAARSALTRARFGELEAVADRLLAILDDPNQSAKHADAVRALGVLQRYQWEANDKNQRYSTAAGKAVQERLRQVLQDGPVELLPAVLVALGGDSADAARERIRDEDLSDDRQAEVEKAIAKFPEEFKQTIDRGE